MKVHWTDTAQIDVLAVIHGAMDLLVPSDKENE